MLGESLHVGSEERKHPPVSPVGSGCPSADVDAWGCRSHKSDAAASFESIKI